MAKRRTKEEFAKWLIKHIKEKYGGNKAEAAKKFDEDRNVVYDVLGGRRSPTKKILDKTGHKKVAVYEER